jgi:hypothetical protein
MSVAGTAGKGEGSATSNALGFAAECPPAGFLSSKLSRDKSVSSLSNPYDTRTEHGGETTDFATDDLGEENSKTESKGKLEWAVADRKRRGPVQSYNAWDPSGQVHHRFRTPSSTDATSTGFNRSSAAEDVQTGRGGFAKAVSDAWLTSKSNN